MSSPLITVHRLLPRGARSPIKAAYLLALRLVYWGRAVCCPCCGRRFRSFAKRPFAAWPNMCPGCGSLGRHRLMWLYLEEGTDLLTRPQSVLHVAPEPYVSKRLAQAPNLDYVSIDLDPRKAQVGMDLMDLRFPDRRFDAIICSHVLEHVDDDRAALRELFRVLKPEGWALLLSPVDPSRATTFDDPTVTSPRERERLFGQHDHVRRYGRDYFDRLNEAGFSLVPDDFWQRIDAERARYHGLHQGQSLYIVRPVASSADTLSRR